MEATKDDDGELRGAVACRGAARDSEQQVMGEAARCGRLLFLRDGHLLTDTTPEGLLAATGEDTLEAAFLTLVRGVDEDVVPHG
jgi:ABC-2 type transport system ATP-binding protein